MENLAHSPTDLLASLLTSFGKVPPKPRGKQAPKPKTPSEILPVPVAFSIQKTGYRTWKAVSRVIQFQTQICKCCGEEITFVKGEFFALENGAAHATWLRPEGYGIEAPDALPLTFSDLEPTFVHACSACRSSPLDDLDLLLSPRQLELPL